MANVKEVVVPDIGGAKEVEVIEVLVKAGDKIAANDSLITLESEKASMEIPSPFAGIVKAVKVKVGDKISQDSTILSLEMTEQDEDKSTQSIDQEQPTQKSEKTEIADPSSVENSQEVHIPDIGGAKSVDVIEVLVKPGDQVNAETSLITLESEKASMEIPSPFAGIVEKISLQVGDKVSQGDLILTLKSKSVVKQAEPVAKAEDKPAAESAKSEQAPALETKKNESVQPATSSLNIHAGPAVRRIAREFGVDLTLVKPTGPKQRILKEDVQTFVKAELAKPKTTSGLNLAPAPAIDFAKFGSIETKPLSRIKKLTGINVHRSWVTIPHVTQFGEADITELERFRESQKAAAEKKGYKLTPLVFIMKAVVAALQELPTFNASLDASGENLILKQYYHIGVAVDTLNGLVVPVIRDVDKKGLYELAKELGEISVKARGKGLSAQDMQGSCFTISSLGGIGGTAFTPIINAPDVAILGISKAATKPVYQNDQLVPRLMLPLSLSYDHRVIDGAEGARFVVQIAERLSDIRTLLL